MVCKYQKGTAKSCKPVYARNKQEAYDTAYPTSNPNAVVFKVTSKGIDFPKTKKKKR